jgi:hypothetical protein
MAADTLGKTQVSVFLVIKRHHPESGIELDHRLVRRDLRLSCPDRSGGCRKYSQPHQDYAHRPLHWIVASYR